MPTQEVGEFIFKLQSMYKLSTCFFYLFLKVNIKNALSIAVLDYSAVDILMNREEIHILEGERIHTNSTHETGCSLSSNYSFKFSQELFYI